MNKKFLSNFCCFICYSIFTFLLSTHCLLLTDVVTAANTESELGEKQRLGLIRTYYDTAIQHFSREEYGKAIKYWEQILKLDPEQIQPVQLIAVARQKMSEKNKKLFKQLENLYEEGSYIQALQNINEITGENVNDPILLELKTKLEAISNNLGDIKAKTKPSELIRNALTIYLQDKPNKRLMMHELLYASQLSSKNAKLKGFVDGIFKEFPKEAKSIPVVPGMDLIEQKLTASLNYIYDAKYDQAVMECNEVLELEPNNIMALKRLGSAYYALGKKANSKQAWQQAYKLNPKDSELKEFLNQ